MQNTKSLNTNNNASLPGRGLGRVLLWFRIIRPHTLFASLTPVLVALYVTGIYSILTACATVFCALALQILSNLINDYYDFLRGTDKAGRVGFKRALAEGEVTEVQMRNACMLTAIMACCGGLILVITGGWVVLAIGLSALLFAWLYTATSHSLSYLGIADIFVFLYYGVIASSGTSFLQLASIYGVTTPFFGSIEMSWSELWPLLLPSFYAGGVSGFISMCVLLINNLRDINSDRAVGKRTLPVRFGKKAGEMLMLLVIMLMPLFAFLAFGYSLPMLIVIPAIMLWLKVLRCEGADYNKCLAMAGMLNMLYFILCICN